MFFSDKSEVLGFPFEPRQSCFSKARIELKNYVLNSAVADSQPLIDLSDEPLWELLLDLYPQLSFIELSQLYGAMEKTPDLMQAMDWTSFFQAQQKQWNQKYVEIFRCLSKLPEEFLNWAHQRKMEIRDLSPLTALDDTDTFAQVAHKFANLTRNQGKQAIDLLVDLILMKKSVDELMATPEPDWIKQLHYLRNPMTAARDAKREQKSHWPKYVQLQKMRSGDKLLGRMQITFSDRQDLQEKLTRLSQQEPQ